MWGEGTVWSESWGGVKLKFVVNVVVNIVGFVGEEIFCVLWRTVFSFCLEVFC